MNQEKGLRNLQISVSTTATVVEGTEAMTKAHTARMFQPLPKECCP